MITPILVRAHIAVSYDCVVLHDLIVYLVIHHLYARRTQG